ncbi:MAG: hypothetical protein ACRCX2_33455 [Paraclostridium sp.]
MIRTKLKYNCNKYEDFCLIEQQFINKYDRSYDIIVTASTKEECEKAMTSIESIMSLNNIQHSFDSNVDPNYNENKNVWTGIVEIYIDNRYVTEQKEEIKEVYKECKLKFSVVEEVAEEVVEDLVQTKINNNEKFTKTEIEYYKLLVKKINNNVATTKEKLIQNSMYIHMLNKNTGSGLIAYIKALKKHDKLSELKHLEEITEEI